MFESDQSEKLLVLLFTPPLVAFSVQQVVSEPSLLFCDLYRSLSMATSMWTCERFFSSCRGSFAIDVHRDKMLEHAIFMMSIEEEFSCNICGDLFCFDCPSFKDEIRMEPEEKEPIGICCVAIEDEHDEELFEDDHDDSSEDDPLLKLSKVSKEKLINGLLSYDLKLHALRKEIKLLEREKGDLSNELVKLKTSMCAFDSLLVDIDNLSNSLACLKSENELLKSNASMPCDSCIALHHELDNAKLEIGNFRSMTRNDCDSCVGMLAEFEKLKLTNSIHLEQLENARAEIVEIEASPCSLCLEYEKLLKDGLVSCKNCVCLETEIDALNCMLNSKASLISCTSCISLKSEIKSLRDDMSAKSCDSCICLHSEIDVLKISLTSLHSELKSSCAKCESLDVGFCGIALDSSSLVSSTLSASSYVVQRISKDKCASSSNGTKSSKEKYHCTFCKKNGHTLEFCFRRLKLERRVRRRTSRNTHGLSHGMCGTSASTRTSHDVDSSRISSLSDNGASSSRTVSTSRPLHHCSFCGKNGHHVDFCFRRAKHLRQAYASKSPSGHSLSHDMHTKEPSTKTRFVDGFFDTFSSGVGQHCGHGLRGFGFGPRAAPRQDFRRFQEVGLVLFIEVHTHGEVL